MNTVLKLKTLTLQEFAEKLRCSGMAIGTEKLKLAIELDVFDCAHKIPMSQDEYIIFEKDVDYWIKAHSVEVEIPQEYLEYEQALRSSKLA